MEKNRMTTRNQDLAALAAENPRFAFELLDTEPAAAELGISRRTMEAWRRVADRGPRFIKVGNKVKYRRLDLLEFLTRRSVASITEHFERSPTPKRLARRMEAAR
jgi:hypothetical protein